MGWREEIMNRVALPCETDEGLRFEVVFYGMMDTTSRPDISDRLAARGLGDCWPQWDKMRILRAEWRETR